MKIQSGKIISTLLTLFYVVGFLKLTSSFFFNEYVPSYMKTGLFSASILVCIIIFEIIAVRRNFTTA